MATIQDNQQAMKNIEKLTAGGQLAIVLCANSFRFGGNWGFITRDKEDFAGQLETLKQERPNIKAFKVKNGALVLANENFLAHNVNLVVPDAIGGGFVAKAKQRRAEEKEKFQKFLDRVVTGKSKSAKYTKDFTEITFGIFSVNDTNQIRINGNEYNAYKLSVVEALEFAHQLKKVGKTAYAKGIAEDGKEFYAPVFDLASSSKGQKALYQALEIAESETGVFITLRIK